MGVVTAVSGFLNAPAITPKPVTWGAVLVYLFFSYVIIFVLARWHLRMKEEGVRGRRMSDMTRVLSKGPYPAAAGVSNMAITTCLMMKKLPSREAMIQLVQERLLQFKRLRSIPVGEFWQEVPVNLEEHVVSVTVKSQKELKDSFEERINDHLDRRRPLWEITMIRNRAVDIEAEEHGTQPIDHPTKLASPPYHAVVVRVDHCIADGVSLVEVFGSCVTDFDGKPLDRQSLIGLKRTPPRKRTVTSVYRHHFLLPRFMSVSRFFRLVKVIFRVLRGIPNSLAMGFGRFDTETAVSGSLYKRMNRKLLVPKYQKMAMSGPYSLSFVKELKAELNVSLNDLMMGAFAGAIRKYCEFMDDGNFPKGVPEYKRKPVVCRALMPFAFLRSPDNYKDTEAALGNNWTFVTADFCVNSDNAVDRVKQTNLMTTQLKKRLQPLANLAVCKFGYTFLPEAMTKQTSWDIYSRHSIVFANVPGAPVKMRLCGSVIEEIQVFFANLIPQVEVFTYAGRMFFNVVADAKAIQDVEKLTKFFELELLDLAKEMGVKTPLEFVDPKDGAKIEITQTELSSSTSESEVDEVRKRKSFFHHHHRHHGSPSQIRPMPPVSEGKVVYNPGTGDAADVTTN